jgi:hypothetical protein
VLQQAWPRMGTDSLPFPGSIRLSGIASVCVCDKVTAEHGTRHGAFFFLLFFTVSGAKLVQWLLLRNFSDQLSRSRVEARLLLFFG